ncbi:hypothetical protein P170DRAFT_94690 [Aspergillus steynii IBT 23096]|uniref:Cell wall protein PhiA n=1 Tax=Aspergillus steynii IBT 23096 TaxID=1392250 RepID=A0A2I2GGF6_9EURO|nr:uncharacterized protein P170DRAFT_94690 [Aspergillus steynii IBT 23096]PLB51969.1 hypothetical protein P170DRAFT_94690 [Aspergillus steynii IBT 23096]
MNFLALLLSTIPLANAQSSPASSASPTPNPSPGGSESGSAFTLNIRWSNSPLSGPLSASAGSFWTGKPTASYCPENVPGCQAVNTTSFEAQDGKLFLNAGVPGGQQVYISPQGKLTYTVPHSGYIPSGSVTDFASWSGDFLNPFLTFWLCNGQGTDSNAWAVWLEYTNGTTGAITNNGMDGENACTRIALQKGGYGGPAAWAFT